VSGSQESGREKSVTVRLLDVPLQGMSDPSTAREAAGAAAEAVRALNHLTIRPPTAGEPGWAELADVYAVVGELRVLVERMPQAFDQLARVFGDPGVEYGVDDDSDPADAVRAAGTTLLAARRQATDLAGTVTRAHGALSHLYVARDR
jgi:hypothetical protein